MTSTNNHINGVVFKDLKSFPDDRGFFREIVRGEDEFFNHSFKQWSHSKMSKNTVKAWHFHHKQIDWWYVGLGVVEAVLFDNREESPTFKQKLVFKLGETEIDDDAKVSVLRIPQGVLHGLKVLTDFAHLFYITSEIYDPQDEGRHPFNSPLVGHDWGDESNLIIAPNDKKTHIPPYARLGKIETK